MSNFARMIRREAMVVRPYGLAAIEPGVLGNSATSREKHGEQKNEKFTRCNDVVEAWNGGDPFRPALSEENTRHG